MEWFREWNYGFFRDKDHSHGVKAGEDWRASVVSGAGTGPGDDVSLQPAVRKLALVRGRSGDRGEGGQDGDSDPAGASTEEPAARSTASPCRCCCRTAQAIQVSSARNPTPEQLAEVKSGLHASSGEAELAGAAAIWDASRPPYPGLPAFQEQQAPVFFGQDAGDRERVRTADEPGPACAGVSAAAGGVGLWQVVAGAGGGGAAAAGGAAIGAGWCWRRSARAVSPSRACRTAWRTLAASAPPADPLRAACSGSCKRQRAAAGAAGDRSVRGAAARWCERRRAAQRRGAVSGLPGEPASRTGGGVGGAGDDAHRFSGAPAEPLAGAHGAWPNNTRWSRSARKTSAS